MLTCPHPHIVAIIGDPNPAERLAVLRRADRMLQSHHGFGCDCRAQIDADVDTRRMTISHDPGCAIDLDALRRMLAAPLN